LLKKHLAAAAAITSKNFDVGETDTTQTLATLTGPSLAILKSL